MEEEKEQKMAMFRFAVINNLLHGGDERTLKKRIREQAARIWTLPDGRNRQFSFGTIEDWLYLYRSGGLKALESGKRKDKGLFRGIDECSRTYIENILKENPSIKTSVILDMMRTAGIIRNNCPSASTVYRFARTVRPLMDAPKKERRSFEAPYAGNLWQTDIMYGPYFPYINERGRSIKRQTFLVAIIDDHSRLLCHGEFFFSQDILAYLSCLKTALCKRGIPERLYCDNGKVFLSEDIKKIMAQLGTLVIHTQIRDCQSKGKIERFFRTVRDSFLDPLMILDKPKDLKSLNQKFWKWSEERYNRKTHSTIKSSPIERWMNSAYKVRLLSPGAEDEIFRFSTTRKVKKDGTISLHNKIYETSWTLAGKKVDVSYDPFSPERPWVSYENESFGRANALSREFNSIMPGRRNQDDK